MSIPIREVVRQLFEKLDLPNYFEYSVFKIMSKTPSNENAKQSPSKAATPINELRWLNPNICLTEHVREWFIFFVALIAKWGILYRV